MRGDGLYKRPGSPYWYYKVKQSGRWYEISTKTKLYQEARKIRSDALKSIEEGRLVVAGLSRLPFAEVSDKYLEAASLRLREKTLKKERSFLVRPIRLFGHIKCGQITAEEIHLLQEAMLKDKCLNSYINLIVDATSRVLQFAKAWPRIKSDVKRLPERARPIARVLTPEEKERLFSVAASNPAWLVAYAAALIASNTTLRGCELKPLEWMNVDLLHRYLDVADSKTEASLRRIPLNNTVMEGFRILRDRLAKLGGIEGKYVFPACEHGHIDPSRHQQSWRSAWRSLTEAAGLKGLRFHDMRHQCITELAEMGHADQTIMAIAGHLSRRMLEHYSHIRLEAKRKAVESLPALGAIQGSQKQPVYRIN